MSKEMRKFYNHEEVPDVLIEFADRVNGPQPDQ